MCRLIVDTSTNTSPAMRNVLFETLIFRALGDQNQAYGIGISDTITVLKSGESPLTINMPAWIEKLDTGRTWFAHLRKPSAGVSAASAEASHPYYFPKSRLIAAHNGYMSDVLPDRAQAGEPHVDSYYAFKILDEIANGETLSRDILNAWIAKLGAASEYSLLIAQDGVLHIIRGNRPLFRVTLNDGEIFCTSEEVLKSTVWFTQRWWPNFYKWGAKISIVPEHTAINTSTGRFFKINTPPPAPAPVRFFSLIDKEWKAL